MVILFVQCEFKISYHKVIVTFFPLVENIGGNFYTLILRLHQHQTVKFYSVISKLEKVMTSFKCDYRLHCRA